MERVNQNEKLDSVSEYADWPWDIVGRVVDLVDSENNRLKRVGWGLFGLEWLVFFFMSTVAGLVCGVATLAKVYGDHKTKYLFSLFTGLCWAYILLRIIGGVLTFRHRYLQNLKQKEMGLADIIADYTWYWGKGVGLLLLSIGLVLGCLLIPGYGAAIVYIVVATGYAFFKIILIARLGQKAKKTSNCSDKSAYFVMMGMYVFELILLVLIIVACLLALWHPKYLDTLRFSDADRSEIYLNWKKANESFGAQGS
ncbi:hypothetical protein NEHOM01_2153 [Nematocida homosporus]|uniref:uncharacterized protein n=1 Tax=Nematocida homosporus TaxID=1912981 RepID=UPI0022205B47|nr:uncharacterized protein NEHOM01_2153 [Nematocida homosporus]KAI5187408.1 hypothetical protein NEHOM01_2153 [Nematocida homosporus]